MARDPITPADPEETQDSQVNPSQTLPDRFETEGDRIHSVDGGGYKFWLRDGYTPYRSKAQSFDVFSKHDDAWMRQQALDPDRMWESTPNEIAGMIGGQERLSEDAKGGMPYATQEPVEDQLQEADSAADSSSPQRVDEPTEAVTEKQLRDQGVSIDLPFEAPSPKRLTYKNSGQQAWTPPPGWRDGMPPIDEKLAADLGVSRELGNSGVPGVTTPGAPAEQEGSTDVGTSGGAEPAPGAESPTGPPRRIRRGSI